MSVEQKTLPEGVQVEKRSNDEVKVRLLPWLYQTIGFLLLLSLLVACEMISVEPLATDIQPTVTVANTEGVPNNEAEDEDGAGLPPDDKEMVEVPIAVDPTVTEAQPTDVPPTQAPEVDPTREAVSQFGDFASLAPEDQEQLIAWAGLVGLGNLGSPDSFRAVNGYQVEVVGDFGPESTNQLGDRIVKMETPPGYFIFTAKVVGADGSEVDVSSGYTLYMTNDGDTEALAYTLPSEGSTGTLVFWIGPKGEQYLFDPVDEEFYTLARYDQIQEVRAAQAAGFATVVSTEYDEATGLTIGYDEAGNPVTEERTDRVWTAYIPPVQGIDYVFGPDGDSVSRLEESPEPSNTITFDSKYGWRLNGAAPYDYDNVVSFTNDMYVQAMANDEFLNTTGTTGTLETPVGPNYSINQIQGGFVAGYRTEELTRPNGDPLGVTHYRILVESRLLDKETGQYVRQYFELTMAAVRTNGNSDTTNAYTITSINEDGTINWRTYNSSGATIPGFSGGVEEMFYKLTLEPMAAEKTPEMVWFFGQDDPVGSFRLKQELNREAEQGVDLKVLLSQGIDGFWPIGQRGFAWFLNGDQQ